jgi:hypothetical protein
MKDNRRQLYNEKFHNLEDSSVNMTNIEIVKTKWADNVALVGEMGCA